ncbi:alpha/beta fold hydrolase [Polaromonas sp.]|uniref:PHA/PHB synthase family protein n=1 Tax=Polaromonas sp. TaxID=1869339 RepID=UPI0013BC0BAA|nr:alpha/beta fold hydrolase [Polaromonas sp.]NDP64730.1 alpha/beta fold hydrolase [Polaromonas sp.]
MNHQPTEHPAGNALDQVVHARLAQLTQGLSPASLASAYLDWFVHLAISPGKQQALMFKAVRKATRIGLHALKSPAVHDAPCIEPLPQDRRFTAPEWQQWPFNLIYQSFLLNQQWWHNATTGVQGVTAHHEQLATFGARQLLDMLSPSNFFLTNPEVLSETLKTGGANLLQGLQNQVRDTLRLASGQPLPGTENFLPGKDVAVTPGKVVFRNHLIELIQYSPQTDTVFAEPVLIVPSWIMKYYILDLSPANSLVRYLVENGHTVFIVSWKNPDASDRDLGMDDYLMAGVMAAIDAVTAIVPAQKIQALGYCLGGTLLTMAAAFMARTHDERLNALVLLAAELDFTEPGELGLFIDESQLAFLDNLMAEKGYLDGKQMAGAFSLLNSRDLVWSRMEHAYLMGHEQPVNDLVAWNLDATRMPYRQHSEYLRRLYLRNDLAEGRYLVDGQPIVLTDIRVPIFMLGTQRDTVSPWHSVYKINLLTDAEVTFCLTTGGHNVGIVNPPGPGVRRSYQLATRAADARYIDPETWTQTMPAHEGSWWPALADWLQQHSGQRVAPPPMGNPARGYPALDDAPGHFVLIS